MEDAMKRLRAELAEARAIYDGRAKTPDAEVGAKAGAVNAIDAVVRFLVDSGVPADDQQPLIDILAAFRDHDRSKPNTLFDKKKRPGGGTLSQHGAWRAVVAAAVTLLVNAGVKKKDAMVRVAGSLKKAGIKGVTSKQLDSWHREISSKRFGDAGAVQIYKSTLDEAAATHPEDPLGAAEVLLAALPKLEPPQEL